MTEFLETRIRIGAPDAQAAFALEKRLSHLHPTGVGRGADWCVELEDVDDRIDEIEAAAEHWLRELGIRSTQMHVNGNSRTIAAQAKDEAPLGSEYATGRVLEHEP